MNDAELNYVSAMQRANCAIGLDGPLLKRKPVPKSLLKPECRITEVPEEQFYQAANEFDQYGCHKDKRWLGVFLEGPKPSKPPIEGLMDEISVKDYIEKGIDLEKESETTCVQLNWVTNAAKITGEIFTHPELFFLPNNKEPVYMQIKNYLNWYNKFIEGPPKATVCYTVDELISHNMVGLYKKKEASADYKALEDLVNKIIGMK